MKKITFQEVIDLVKGKELVVHAPMYGKPQRMKAAISTRAIGLGWVALDASDKFTFRDGDTIGYKSLDDGNGYIRILP